MSLKDKIQQLVADIPVTFGVGIKYLESGEEVMLNADRPYQLASVFKIPVLITALQQVDAGRFTLDDRVELKDEHKTMPSGILAFLRAGLRPTVKDLLMLMIIISDNTTTDMVLELVGGPSVVNDAMRKLGFGESDINITMSVHDLFDDVFGTSECLLKSADIVARIKENGINFDGEVYRAGSTANVATPRAMTRLNEMIFHGEVASRQACDTALDIMLHQTLNDRLPSGLRPGTPIAHKTGTIAGVRNDSGIIYTDDAHHVAITVFTRNEKELDMEEILEHETEEKSRIDKAIGEIAKLAFEYAKEQIT